jgi:hypothetical protein
MLKPQLCGSIKYRGSIRFPSQRSLSTTNHGDVGDVPMSCGSAKGKTQIHIQCPPHHLLSQPCSLSSPTSLKHVFRTTKIWYKFGKCLQVKETLKCSTKMLKDFIGNDFDEILLSFSFWRMRIAEYWTSLNQHVCYGALAKVTGGHRYDVEPCAGKKCSMSEAKSLSNYKFDYSMRNPKKKHILWRPHSYSETRGFKLDGSSRKR